jgi:hypothetical protein
MNSRVAQDGLTERLEHELWRFELLELCGVVSKKFSESNRLTYPGLESQRCVAVRCLDDEPRDLP